MVPIAHAAHEAELAEAALAQIVAQPPGNCPVPAARAAATAASVAAAPPPRQRQQRQPQSESLGSAATPASAGAAPPPSQPPLDSAAELDWLWQFGGGGRAAELRADGGPAAVRRAPLVDWQSAQPLLLPGAHAAAPHAPLPPPPLGAEELSFVVWAAVALRSPLLRRAADACVDAAAAARHTGFRLNELRALAVAVRALRAADQLAGSGSGEQDGGLCVQADAIAACSAACTSAAPMPGQLRTPATAPATCMKPASHGCVDAGSRSEPRKLAAVADGEAHLQLF
eukprot:365613-Chlamydomonas_euryale.AAC.1